MNELSPLLPPSSPLGRKAFAPSAQARKAKPDARPMRVVLGTAGLAAFSALVAAIVIPPTPIVSQPVTYAQLPGPAGPVAPANVQPPVHYVQLQPGQTAPPGAKVVDSSAQPIVQAPAAPAAPLKPIIIRTTQSGKVIP